MIRFSPIGYATSVWRDVRASIDRVWHDRSALAALFLLLLPWASLLVLRDNLEWVNQLGQMAGVVWLFWWMSRSASAAPALVKRPALESVLAIALVVLWAAWRAGICGKWLPFLPSQFNCYNNLEYEIIPKLIEMTLFPFLVLFGVGYRFRGLGSGLSLRSFWVALPVLVLAAGYGVYLHWNDPPRFVRSSWDFFLGAGLPEEFLFRAILLARLEAWWRSPGWALFGSSVIFGLSHLPIDYYVFTSRNWSEAWITLLTFQMGFGAVFGFAYQRVRNIWPIAIFHAMVDAL